MLSDLDLASPRSSNNPNPFLGSRRLQDSDLMNKLPYPNSPKSDTNLDNLTSPLMSNMNWELKSNPDLLDNLKFDIDRSDKLSRTSSN